MRSQRRGVAFDVLTCRPFPCPRHSRNWGACYQRAGVGGASAAKTRVHANKNGIGRSADATTHLCRVPTSFANQEPTEDELAAQRALKELVTWRSRFVLCVLALFVNQAFQVSWFWGKGPSFGRATLRLWRTACASLRKSSCTKARPRLPDAFLLLFWVLLPLQLAGGTTTVEAAATRLLEKLGFHVWGTH